MSHAERHDAQCLLDLWTVSVSCRTAFADRTRVAVPRDVDFAPDDGCCWTRGGWFVFHDRAAAVVYRVRPGDVGPAVCATGAGRAGGPDALVRPAASGFALHTGDRLTVSWCDCHRGVGDGDAGKILIFWGGGVFSE